MFELGETSAYGHQFIANLAAQLDIDHLILLGSHFEKTNTTAFKFTDVNQLKEQNLPVSLQKALADATILIKGSRGMKLETLLDLVQ